MKYLIIINKISCYDSNCDICFSELKGACVHCKEGCLNKKGECIQIYKRDEYYNHITYFSQFSYFAICAGLHCSRYYNHGNYLCSSNKCLIYIKKGIDEIK